MRMLIVLSCLAILATPCSNAQDTQSAYCTFEDGNQVLAQFSSQVKDQPHNGRVWSPGITLFVQTPLKLGGSDIGLGAYSVYLIPDKKNWTLIVNRNVKAGSAYDASQDVAKSAMDTGEIPEPSNELQVSFAREGDKKCGLRVYYAKTGAFTDFFEK